MAEPLRIGVIGSGGGTNCQSIIDACESSRLDGQVVCVVSDVEDAFILERARKHSIPAEYISADPFKTKLEGAAEKAYIEALRNYDVTLVALAGFMRVVKPGLLASFPEMVVNIHPALLPSFPGLEAWTQALKHGVKITGCTVHIVEEGIDAGPILVQKSVPVLAEDTPDTLHQRILEQEHIAYPEGIAVIVSGSLKRDGRRLL